VNLALDALGLDRNDPRGLTVTGGLPFAGGAGSNYMMHSVATMIDVLRRDPGSLGMVSGVGMHMTKHIFGVYSTTPPSGPIPPTPDTRPPSRTVPITDVVSPGTSGTVATYTVAHSRDGEPEWGLVICDLDDGSRCYGRVADTDLLRDMEDNEWVGATLLLTPNAEKVNLATSLS
jgi:acetyl-CoA C-acetyltransferase